MDFFIKLDVIDGATIEFDLIVEKSSRLFVKNSIFETFIALIE